MIEINLLPDVKQELIRAQIQRNLIISVSILSAIIAGVLVVIVASYVYGAQALIMRNANSNIDSEYAKLTSVEDLDKMLTIQNQLNTVSSLDQKKYVTSRLYDMLNVVVPDSPNDVTISSMAVQMPMAAEDGSSDPEMLAGEGAVVTIEGQTSDGYAGLEAFEKMIASAVIEFVPKEGASLAGEFSCGNQASQCKWLTLGGGDRASAVQVKEMSFEEDQTGKRMLFFQLSFTIVPELLSNSVEEVGIKIGKDGNVTDSSLGIPRAIFEDRPALEEDW